MFKSKEKYIYIDNFGKKHKVRISLDDVSCIPYYITDTGIKALRVQNLCKLMFWEKYNDVNLCSKSIICKYDESLLHKCLSKNDVNKLAIPEEKLKEIIDKFEKIEQEL